MTDRRVFQILLNVLTCAAGGAVLLPTIVVLILFCMGYLATAWVGAAIGMCVGIVWTIPNWLARFHVMLWTGLGLVVGMMFSISTNSGVPVVVFSAAGIFVGIVCALATVGAFRDK